MCVLQLCYKFTGEHPNTHVEVEFQKCYYAEHPSAFSSRSFLGIGLLVFFKLSMMLEAHVVLYVAGPGFLDFFPKKWGKWAKNRIF